MKLIENQLIRQARGGMMRSRLYSLTPHLIGPLYTFMFTMLLELLDRNFEWYDPSLALTFIGLAIGAIFSGLRSALVSATIIVIFGLVEFEYNTSRIVQTALAAYGCAFVYGHSRRLLIKWYREAELNRRKAELVDNLNGNLQTTLKGLRALDKLRIGWDDFTEPKRLELVEEAIGILSNLLTMTRSWREIAETKEKAVDYLNQMANYPYRVDDAVKDILANQQQTLKLVMHLARIVEEKKDSPTKTQELKQ
jgi:hypothetical protein